MVATIKKPLRKIVFKKNVSQNIINQRKKRNKIIVKKKNVSKVRLKSNIPKRINKNITPNKRIITNKRILSLTKPKIVTKSKIRTKLGRHRYNIIRRYSINTSDVSQISDTNIRIKHIFNNNSNEDKTYIWEKDNNITLTVALPAYRSRKIIYLALESLKNQKKINFNWELIIVEEHGHSYELVKKYENILPNCTRIVYVGINRHILLLEKWKAMAMLASNTSKIYVMQAADCYSSPKRLYIHNRHFKNSRCYFSTQMKGLFFNLLNRDKVFYNGLKIDGKKTLRGNHLNMALRTKDMKDLPLKKINKGLDAYIRKFVWRRNKLKINNYIFADTSIDKNNWKYSIDTDGANNISLRRRNYYRNPKKQFVLYKHHKGLGYINMNKYIPRYIIRFLNNYTKK